MRAPRPTCFVTRFVTVCAAGATLGLAGCGAVAGTAAINPSATLSSTAGITTRSSATDSTSAETEDTSATSTTESSTTESSTESSTESTASTEATESTEATPSLDTTAGPLGAELPVFGDTFEWDNGLSVTVSPGTPFTPSEYSAEDPASPHLGFTVTVLNNTGETYDPTLFLVSAQSGTTEATQIFDSANGFEGTPTTGVLDGRESTFAVGFGVADPADVVMEVSPGFDYEPALFTTTAGDPAAITPSLPETTADTPTFGETYPWEDGLSVSVGTPSPFTPSETAAAEPAAAYVTFPVTITNNSPEIFDPGLFVVTAQSGATEADEIFDSANGVGGTPSTDLLPGRQATFDIAFGMDDPADVVMEINPSPDYESVVFASRP